ncbi:AglZ/HisF2 family acetamidino modification protein [uncultured Pseudodesulfovibrio sp.]|uniref:AglZ/HisF2 family acetamidino modification protein n=1 Tax=uncultured Pseudodesulfovibrio sp. TaxID=2035858 RepID=UPI0029C9573B|nr:AglZ/HisF2 family acetamidino modification protein [uncultured Pseudodesulfovibrio sp.]
MRPRIIPVLLMQDGELVKTTRFKKGNYIGDPINAIRLFNDLQTDEIVILDISASRKGYTPNLQLITDMASECFMPLTYGGGITRTDQIEAILACGVEKCVIELENFNSLSLLKEGARRFGNQSIVASISVKRNIFGKPRVYNYKNNKNTKLTPVEHARRLEQAGAGELLINDVDRDGSMKGYDLQLVSDIAGEAGVPVICCGGAGKLQDYVEALKAGADAAAAGSNFVYKGAMHGVLINYLTANDFKELETQLMADA